MTKIVIREFRREDGIYKFVQEQGYASGPALAVYKNDQLEKRTRMPKGGFMRDKTFRRFFNEVRT